MSGVHRTNEMETHTMDVKMRVDEEAHLNTTHTQLPFKNLHSTLEDSKACINTNNYYQPYKQVYNNGENVYDNGNGDTVHGKCDTLYGNGDTIYGNGATVYGNGATVHRNGDTVHGNGDAVYGNYDNGKGEKEDANGKHFEENVATTNGENVQNEMDIDSNKQLLQLEGNEIITENAESIQIVVAIEEIMKNSTSHKIIFEELDGNARKYNINLAENTKNSHSVEKDIEYFKNYDGNNVECEENEIQFKEEDEDEDEDENENENENEDENEDEEEEEEIEDVPSDTEKSVEKEHVKLHPDKVRINPKRSSKGDKSKRWLLEYSSDIEEYAEIDEEIKCLPSSETTTTYDEEVYICEQCGYLCRSNDELNSHHLEMHENEVGAFAIFLGTVFKLLLILRRPVFKQCLIYTSLSF